MVLFILRKFIENFCRIFEFLCYYYSVGFNRLANSHDVNKAQPEYRSERNLAVAILKQAWQEAIVDLYIVKESSRKDYVQLKEKAIDWIASDDDGFPFWCELADIDHIAIRQRLGYKIKCQKKAAFLRTLSA